MIWLKFIDYWDYVYLCLLKNRRNFYLKYHQCCQRMCERHHWNILSYCLAVFSGISHYSEASNHKSNNPKRKLKTSDQLKSEFISHMLWRNFWDKLHEDFLGLLICYNTWYHVTILKKISFITFFPLFTNIFTNAPGLFPCFRYVHLSNCYIYYFY